MKKDTNNDIFGRPWETIQAMQQGTYRAPLISGAFKKPEATNDDIELLKIHGVSGLETMQFHGCIDRLKTSGLI